MEEAQVESWDVSREELDRKYSQFHFETLTNELYYRHRLQSATLLDGALKLSIIFLCFGLVPGFAGVWGRWSVALATAGSALAAVLVFVWLGRRNASSLWEYLAGECSQVVGGLELLYVSEITDRERFILLEGLEMKAQALRAKDATKRRKRLVRTCEREVRRQLGMEEA